ncbi:hypothetical protein Aspvir_007015 [Aspergillus viridinutans]|uniref:FAD-binding domain-containing protein n=1 Tax=Aspergillus viridinutans TaxID=75553 RepID=A0A9P3F5Y5_ASPVI|nr:uncharacterized protein Aspvir_007015 [Aspergillus viridinutans]GIK02950.1 hypothetical protein Aspvir_007015 [Aspergillus viridinutans]
MSSELSAMVREANIPINYHKKFVHILTETEEGIIFKCADSTTETATCLVSADGIHSRVHKYLYLDLEPIFTNIDAVTAAVPASQL